MNGSRFRHAQPKDIEGQQHKTRWSEARPANNHVSSRLDAQQTGSWIETLVLTAKSSFLSIRKAPAKPTLLAVLTHGIVLATIWVPSVYWCTCEQLFVPSTWVAVLWAAISCAEVLFGVSVGWALCKHLASGTRSGISTSFFLTLLYQLLLVVETGVHLILYYILLMLQAVHTTFGICGDV